MAKSKKRKSSKKNRMGTLTKNCKCIKRKDGRGQRACKTTTGMMRFVKGKCGRK